MFQPVKPAFRVVESYAIGLRLMTDHVRLFCMLSIIPLIAAFATLVALRLTGGITLFWLPLMQMPANFIQGLQSALIIRFLLLQEFPLIVDDARRRERNRDVLRAALVYAIITYLFNGLMAGMMFVAKRLEVEPQVMAPYSPLIIASLVLVFWSIRWFWVPLPVALGWNVEGLFSRLRGWAGSLRIGGLFVLCSLTVSILTSLLRYMIAILAGVANVADLKGVFAVLDDGLVAASTIAMAILFTCASAHALKSMTSFKQQV